MKKQELAKDILHYTFATQPGRIWATSATVILNGKKALLIDTGYAFQTSLLLEDLASKHIEVEALIITHFHDDHMEGLKFLPGIPVYGSSRFQDALDKWIPKENHKYFTPTILLDAPTTITFGERTLTLIPAPGHSKCGLFVKIDNQFLHLADEIMFSAEGKPLLPSIDKGNVKAHLDSLESLRGYDTFTLLPSHGPVFDGEKLADEIENRQIYLNALLDSNRLISFEDATKNCTCMFVHNDWHEDNCK